MPEAPEDPEAPEGGVFELIKNRINVDGVSQAFGIVMDEVSAGHARAHMDMPPHGANFLGIPHGAVIYALADQVFAAASNSHDRISVALQISINYTRMVDYGERVVAEAREIHSTRRTGVYEMRVTTEAGDLVAAMQGTVYRKDQALADFLASREKNE